MNDSKKKFALMLVFSTSLGSAGQLLFKEALGYGVGVLFALVLFLGLVCYGLATLVYFYILSKVHLGWAYGFQGLSYIFATLLAVFILGEQVSAFRWVGVALIVVGVALVGLS